jgi:hypothetical protein
MSSEIFSKFVRRIRRVAASIAGICDGVNEERVFWGPMDFWLPASSCSSPETAKISGAEKILLPNSATPTIKVEGFLDGLGVLLESQ